MSNPRLDRFADLLIRHVRDQAIADADRLTAGQVGGPAGDRWRGITRGPAAAAALANAIPDVVDATVFALLDALDNGLIPPGFRDDDGDWASLDDIGQGEMAGWYSTGSDGWRQRYSRQRHFDDLPDLRSSTSDTREP
jgi:hypothetical protein